MLERNTGKEADAVVGEMKCSKPQAGAGQGRHAGQECEDPSTDCHTPKRGDNQIEDSPASLNPSELLSEENSEGFYEEEFEVALEDHLEV